MSKESPESPEALSTAEFERRMALYAAVGTVASTWAALELRFDVSALELAGIRGEAGFCFTAQIAGSARKLDAYIAVAALKGAKRFLGELNGYAKDTAGLAEQRNRIVHDPWFFFEPQSPQRLENTARRKLRSRLISVDTKDVLKLSGTITAHALRFVDIHDRVKSATAA